ncbi:MAG: alpha amylase C-terminal domain-containing protein, partial [Bacteroidota bacterium]
DANDSRNSILSFIRYDKKKEHPVMVVVNLTPVPRPNYRIGVPEDSRWLEILNSDATQYGGSGTGNFGGVAANPVPFHGEEQSINVMLPPLGVVMFAAP